MSTARRYDETITLPRAVRFPIEMIPPEGFDPGRLETWPEVRGRLEYVEGRLLYMPPCGDEQQDTVADVVITLGAWVRANPRYVLGTNEAGMRLGGATRGADAAIWRRVDAGARTGGLRRSPPALAVEVGGLDDTRQLLEDKARWYLEHGVEVVWIVLPRSREVVVVTTGATTVIKAGQQLPTHPALPGLAPDVDAFFVQLDAP